MAKTGGLGDNYYVQGLDLSGDTNAISRIGGGPAALDVTGLRAGGFERIGGKRDGGFDFSAWFNPYSPGVPAGMYLLPAADVIGSYCRGTAVGNDGAACIARQLNWDGTRGNDGSMSFACSLQADGTGLEWGTQHTAGIQLDAAAATAAGMDSGAAGLSFGAQMYVHVFSVTGTSVTIKLQDFTTDVPGSYTDITGLTTTAITPAMCPYAVRVATASNALVRRWTRVVSTGTFTNASFAVLLVRNPVAVSF
jgi:hypothetical protein